MVLSQVWFVALGMVLTVAGTASAAMKELTILHTGDLYGHVETWLGRITEQ